MTLLVGSVSDTLIKPIRLNTHIDVQGEKKRLTVRKRDRRRSQQQQDFEARVEEYDDDAVYQESTHAQSYFPESSSDEGEPEVCAFAIACAPYFEWQCAVRQVGSC